ncbi:two-component regulator propeller domain-containing protein [Maribacter sp. 2304DJ31-5]|uniref:hybrid sensor histidine kinase/response regulator transcription factor n=1 Tax=Maribacter sp. 2304DJ31-5 TaxID=3386273 RepID=UPI0039BC24FF
MVRFLYILSVLMLTLSVNGLHGQNIKIEHLLIEEGLSRIKCITRDREGFMWFGSFHGLYRYDGHHFKTFKHNPNDSISISGNNIKCLYEDKQGYLWVGTDSKGLNRFDPRTATFTQGPKSSSFPEPLRMGTIATVYEDHKGKLWVGTIGDGLFLLDEKRKVIAHFRHDSNNPNSIDSDDVFSIIEDEYRQIWITTNFGALNRYDPKKQGFESFVYNPVDYMAVAKGQVLINDPLGNIWIGTEGDGLYQFNQKTEQFVHYVYTGEANSISSSVIKDLKISFDRQHLWIATDGGGLSLMDLETKVFQHFKYDNTDKNSLYKNSIYCIYIDNYDRTWLGVGDGDINIIKKSEFKHYRSSTSQKYNLSTDRVISLLKSSNDDLIWTGIGGKGMDTLKLSNNKFGHVDLNDPLYDNLSKTIITSLMEDRNGDIWMAYSLEGIDLFNRKENNIVHYENNGSPKGLNHDNVRDVIEGGEGKIWIATDGGGLNVLDRETDTFEHFSPDKANSGANRLFDICEDTKGNIWAGTLGSGLYRFNKKEKHFDHHTLDGARIFDIANGSSQDLWVGTEGRGLFRLDLATGSTTQFVEGSGLPSNAVYGILLDNEKKVWISTNKGIAKLDPDTGSINSYNTFDDLPTNDFTGGAICKTDDGTLYFGCKRGVVSFHPKNLSQDTTSVEVSFTTFKLFNQEVVPGKSFKGTIVLDKSIGHTSEIALPYQLNNFSIEFAAPKYPYSGKVQYRYKLQGVDEEWVKAGSFTGTGTYSNLSEGNYQLQVAGSDRHGVWKKPKTLYIKIRPPIWRTPWAYASYLLLITGVWYTIYRIKLKQVRLVNQLDIEQIKHQKDNELHLLKIGFFTNISHELRTSLMLMLGPLEKLMNTPEITKEQVQNRLLTIQKSSQRLHRLINQLLDLRKLETKNMKLQVAQGDIVGFIKEVYTTFKESAQENNIAFTIRTDAGSVMGWYDRSKLEVILFNLLSNAFKFTKSGDSITMNVDIIEAGEKMRIIVRDSGKGIPEDSLSHIFESFYQVKGQGNTFGGNGSGIGLALTKNLVDLYRGTITVESEEGKGSRFLVKLPFKKEHFGKEELVTATIKSERPVRPIVLLPSTKKPILSRKNRQNSKNTQQLLIVEDNDELRSYLVDSMLEHYSVKEAIHGKQAFELAIADVPDIIISDVMMPELDGIELCRLLKQDERTSHIPLILLTARTSETYHLQGLEYGADDYITKPFGFQLLKAKVENLLAKQARLKEKFARKGLLQPERLAHNKTDELFIKKITQIIEKQLDNPNLSVKDIAGAIGMSHSVLYRKMVAISGKSVNEFIRTFRLEKAKKILVESDFSISEIGDATGFSNVHYFSKCFKSEFGESPSKYRKRLSKHI